MGKYLIIRNLIAFILIISIICGPTGLLFAQELPSGGATTGGTTGNNALFPSNTTIQSNPNSQGATYVKTGGSPTENKTNNSAGKELAADAVGCGVGQILGNIVQAGVSAVVGSIKSSVTNTISNQLSLNRVPTQDADTPAIRDDSAKTTAKDAGGGNPTLLGSISGILDISWDSIGFCLANAAVHYVAQSTINWINSGFEGNPVFVDNPEQFFRDVADAEAGAFIEELGLGFLCSEFAPKVRIALVNDYVKRTSNSYDNIKCTFTGAEKNLQGFMNDFRQGGLSNYVEFVSNPGNRAQSSYLASQDLLNARLNKQKAQLDLELNWGRGILSIKDCPKTVSGGKTTVDKKNCVTKTPGQVIQGQIESTLNLPKDRLSIADEFDEVVVALVNYLIKTALSESLTNDTRGGQYGTGSGGNNDNNNDNEDNNNSNTYNQPIYNQQNPQVTTNPNQPRPLQLSCTADKDSVKVDEYITFTATPSGLSSSNITFDWLGDSGFPTSTSDRNLTIYYSATGTSNVSVRVKNGTRTATAVCPVVTISPAPALVGSCSPDRTTALVNETVVWNVTASGGNGNYSYLWGGDDELAGKTVPSPAIGYAKKGRKDGKVTIASGSQTITVDCTDRVRVK